MITARTITDGGTYLKRHLTANDYYAEGEKVEGEWFGKGAEKLGLQGTVDAETFELLRSNVNPATGKRLTARTMKPYKVTNPVTGKVEERNPIALHDITFSAPKSASIVAIVGDDPRVTKAFRASVKVALGEMEHFAAVRLRTAGYHETEKIRISDNVTAALFFHDSSRSLDPQLHAHAVMTNASYDAERDQWFALQRRAMMEASPYVRKVLYHDFARRLKELGYTVESEGESFRIQGITKEMEEAFSVRANQRKEFEERYRKLFGHGASKRRIEEFIKDDRGSAELRFTNEFKTAFGRVPNPKEIAAFVRDWRDPKLQEISTPEVREQQRARLSDEGRNQLSSVRATANKATPSPLRSVTEHRQAIERGIDHCLERLSVARFGDVLDSSLRFGSKELGDIDPRLLRTQLLQNSEAIHNGYQLTTETALAEEAAVLRFARETRADLPEIGSIKGEWLADYKLSEEQHEAVKTLAGSRHGMSILIGDAGTGKTHALKALQQAHRERYGDTFIALAPTTRATQELQSNGYPEATTVAALIVDERMHEAAQGRALLVDEAGLLSSRQLAQLVKIAEERNARFILVGDTKQHESVERGSALRNLIDSKYVTPVRLSKVRRQHQAGHRKLAKLLAAGRARDALDHADELGLVEEVPHVPDLFKAAAKRYADNVDAGRETLVVIPTWNEIDEFNQDARAELKCRGLIHGEEIEIEGSASLSWTEVEKTHWQDYERGHVLNFHKRIAKVDSGESLTVTEVLPTGLECVKQDGTIVRITKKQRGAFDVAESQRLSVAAGDELLFRANCPEVGVSNGQRRKVKAVSESGEIELTTGNVLPTGFTQVCHGHAVTSHKSQGASVDESILVIGPHSLSAANLRQLYVSNTRFKQDHRLFVHNLNALLGKVMTKSERPLAREFLAEMGKELETLLEAKPSHGPQEAKQRSKRLNTLLAEVERYEKRADWRASRSALFNKLGVHQWPKRIRKRWKDLRRQRAREANKKNFNTFAFIRRFRKGTFILKFNRLAARRRAATRKL
jgi:conjugative relaxase-like TrwC/TraI family protein